MYAFSDAYLRYGTVKKLVKVADFFASINDGGYKIIITEAYRPKIAHDIIVGNLTSYEPFCTGSAVRIIIANPDGSAAEDLDGGLYELLIMQMELKGFTWDEINNCFVDDDSYAVEDSFLSSEVITPA